MVSVLILPVWQVEISKIDKESRHVDLQHGRRRKVTLAYFRPLKPYFFNYSVYHTN